MSDIRRMDDRKSRQFWESVERMTKEVSDWPSWKKGESAVVQKEDAKEERVLTRTGESGDRSKG